MVKQRITAIIATDLSVAFDTAYHNITLDALNNQFGYRTQLLNGMIRICDQAALR